MDRRKTACIDVLEEPHETELAAQLLADIIAQ
jgi:hypothetical protein